MSKQLVSFDYAIKYLLKDKDNHIIIESFVSSVFKTCGYSNIKIVQMLDAGSNKEHFKSKSSLADLIVEDEKHRFYVVEIDKSYKQSYIHKALFKTSRLFVDSIAECADYIKISKIFHISLLFFQIGNDTVYHGKLNFFGLSTGEKLTSCYNNLNHLEVSDATQIFPEYLVISIPNFNDCVEKELDEWLFLLKNDRVPPNCTLNCVKIIKEKLSILKMPEQEQYKYLSYKTKIIDKKEILKSATLKGKEEGKEEGKKEAILTVATNLLKAGSNVDFISSMTGLRRSQIENLNK
nr:uncharacterized protein LOC124810541 [Hydra vulgaris]XP_047131542.1 uncharacterized protein LOC124810541 [Hydra vulgaris]XP_047131552.1 uncharacterized protein LOC124810541 [Hydra vulgaris]